MSPSPRRTSALRRLSCAIVLPAALLLAAPAVAHEDDYAAPSEPVSEQTIVAALGGDAEPISDHLYEVEVPAGPDLLTHGPDVQLDAPLERATGFSAGDPQRPPVCATDHYQQILYGHLASAPNRLASTKASIQAQMMRTNALLNQDSLESGGPTADYKMLCDADGAIDVQAFAAPGASFADVVAGARLAGFDNPDVDYTIFFDDPTSNACGVGSYYSDERLSEDNRSNTGGGFAVSYSDCWFGNTPMHENGHNQGAVQRGAPYSTGTGGHCWDEEDVMCYSPDGGDLHQQGTIDRCTDRLHFDCGFDTYFDSAPETGEYLATHWNIGSSLNRFVAFDSGNHAAVNTPPGASFGFGCSGGECRFTDTSSDSDGAIAQRSWRFGDGGVAYERAPAHRYAEDGTYSVTLTVTDDAGARTSVTRKVVVGGAPVTLRSLRSGARQTARSGVAGSWDFYVIKARRKTRSLRVSLSGPACSLPSCDPDLDLYVRRGERPTLSAFTCGPRLVGSSERCKVSRPRRGRWIVGVHVHEATAAANYSLSLSARQRSSR